MQAVIMAGGKGTRLAAVAANIPKPMVSLRGKPLLEYQVENLKQYGVTDIILIVGHLGDVIVQHFGDGSRFGVSIRYYSEQSPLGTAGALSQIQDELENTFFLIFGDLFINLDFQRFFTYHKESNAQITLFAHPNSHPYDSDLILTEQDGRVCGWNSKHAIRTDDYKNLVNAGLYVFEKTIIQHISAVQNANRAVGLDAPEKVDLEKDIVQPLIPAVRVCAYQSTEYVKDIGTVDRLHKVTTDLEKGICERRNLRHKQKCIFLDRDGTINRYVGFLRSTDQMELVDGAANAIKMINASEYLAIVITNQPVIARGECTFEEMEKIHNRMHTQLGKEGAYLDGLYYCPHHPHSGFEGEVKPLKIDCDCRKPKTGLLKQAAKQYNIDLQKSWFVGDTATDIQTGTNAGMRTALIHAGAAEKGTNAVQATFHAENILDAIIKILSSQQDAEKE